MSENKSKDNYKRLNRPGVEEIEDIDYQKYLETTRIPFRGE